MFLSSFKTEHQAVMPKLIFTPTMETLKMVVSDPNMFSYLKNSFFQVFFTTVFCLILAVPASFALVFGKFKKKGTGEKVYLWFITTILLPPRSGYHSSLHLVSEIQPDQITCRTADCLYRISCTHRCMDAPLLFYGCPEIHH